MNNNIEIFAPLSLEEERRLIKQTHDMAYIISQNTSKIVGTETLDLSNAFAPLSLEEERKLIKQTHDMAYIISQNTSKIV